jgi:phenylpropionate dioxygenase-like ring-hydroxylating dioxygenase large terminal subunit
MTSEDEAKRARDYSSLVGTDRVHRSIYSDPDIFQMEMQSIFGDGWVYVGHDSQIPNPGDYLTTRIGLKPIVVVRHTDGQIYVVFNSCGHRGAIVCNEERGNAKLFQCAYHAWTFKTNGDLDAVAMPKGYSKAFDLSDPSLGMRRLPRVSTYGGFVFASLADTGPDLQSWLGAAKSSIDEILARAPAGEIELTGGVHRYIYRGNWKLQLENVVDMYHVPFSHESTVSRGGKQFGRRPGEKTASEISSKGKAAVRWEERIAWGAARYGHSYTGHQPVAESLPDDPVFQSYFAALEQRHGAPHAREVLLPTRHNTAFFPNLTLQALNLHVRVILPISVDRTEVRVYPIKLKGAPDEMNQGSIRHLNLTHSAASLIQTDDLECFRRCQDGGQADNSEWVWFARGVDTDKVNASGDTINHGTVETPQRAMYKAWLALMNRER